MSQHIHSLRAELMNVRGVEFLSVPQERTPVALRLLAGPLTRSLSLEC